MVNVLLVDDHELVRTGIQHLLEENESVDVVGVASSGEEAIRLVEALQPDIVLMDIYMPGMGGIEASRKISQRRPDVKIIILTVLADGPLPQQMLIAGVQGYVTKTCSIAELIAAIMAVSTGERYLCHEMASKLALSSLATGKGSPFEELSHRELQVVLMTLQGRDLGEIAQALAISPKTVSTYRSRVYEKLAVKNNIELMRLAFKYNIAIDSV